MTPKRKTPATSRNPKAPHPKLTPRRIRELSALGDRIDREEAEELKARARSALAEYDKLQDIIQALKRARLEQGLSLADVDARSGIGRANLCRMENMTSPNPTIDTITRYAAAVGKKVIIKLADRSAIRPRRSA